MSISIQNGDTNGLPEASAESNSANGGAEKVSTTSARKVSPKSGNAGGPSSTSGLPTVNHVENQSMRRQKDRSEVKMFWALAKVLLRKHGGKVMLMESHGIKYLAVSFHLSEWDKEIADGRSNWMPKSIIDNGEKTPTVEP